MKIGTKNLIETEALGRKIAAVLRPGDVLDLRGELGAGKTALTKGIVAALGGEASSPSFAIVHRYETEPVIYHCDFYRLEDEMELEDLDYERFLYPEDAVATLEWSEHIASYLPEDVLRIEVTNTGEEHLYLLPEELEERL